MTAATSTADFSFPLNVYARIIELEDGGVEYLHYGMFEQPGESAGIAQRRAAELLWSRLPPPCKTLDVGIGLGTTLARLLAAGYATTGITPDAAQIRHVGTRLGTAPLVQTRFEDFAADPGRWYLILFQESAQYIDPIDLFEGADRLLAANGEVFVMDEFSLRRDAPERENLHYLPHFIALAERFGFGLTEEVDLSTAATPTLDWLLAAVGRHADRLRGELALSAEQIEALNAANRRYAANYADGHYGYRLLRFVRGPRPQWRPGRIIGAGRAAEMRALFAQVFGHEMSPAHWHWKYGDERGAGIGIWRHDGQLVAHYGGTSRRISMFGRPERAFQACDLMVAESDRGTLTRRGPVFLAAATFLEHELGYGAPHLLGVGFPNKKAYELPRRLGLYTGAIARIQEVSWPAVLSRPSLRYRIREIDVGTEAGAAAADACWEAMRASMDAFIVGARDAAYLRHRYAEHPDKRYRIFLAESRFGRRPLGLLVLQTGARCELLDAVGALAAMPRLVHHARRVAAAMGAGELFAWLADNILPHFLLPPEARVSDIDVVVPANNWTPGPAQDDIVGKWWLTGGDTDFH